jgi:trk system potassium uptake protein TrkA
MAYAIIVGGGKIGYYLARSLINRDYEVLLMEKDGGASHTLSADLGDVVMQGDGCEPTVLQEAGAERADLVVAATGDDADNLVVCQMASHCFGVPRIIARVNNPDNEALFEKLGVRERINGTSAILNLIGQKVGRASVVLMGALEHSEVEVVEIIVDERSPLVGAAVGELQLPEGALFISVLRAGRAAIPNAETTFENGDVVVALVPTEMESLLREFVA